jgi:hypothetical protein
LAIAAQSYFFSAMVCHSFLGKMRCCRGGVPPLSFPSVPDKASFD